MNRTQLVLTNRHVTAVVEPDNGANIRHIGIGSAQQHNVLAQYDWVSPVPSDDGASYGDSRLDWLSGYRGGWQILTPNAGAECETGGVTHPFHGEVSTSKWTVDRLSPSSVLLSTGTRGPIRVERQLSLDPDRSAVEVRTALINDTAVRAHALFVEHIAFSSTSDSRVSMPRGSTWHHDPASPEARLGMHSWNEQLERPVADRMFRLAYLDSGSEGWAEIEQPHIATRCRVTWDATTLPSLWYWQERGSDGYPWYGRADITALEPATSSPSDGLAAAIREGRAIELGPGERADVSVRVEVNEIRQDDREQGASDGV